jgi:hypothetical protein
MISLRRDATTSGNRETFDSRAEALSLQRGLPWFTIPPLNMTHFDQTGCCHAETRLA